MFTKALYRTKSDCLAAIWFDAPPNGNGYISSSASSRCIFDGWGSTFLFLLVFRLIRMRTGGYHAKTPTGCLLGSTFTMIVSLEFAKRLHPVSNLICLTAASVLILRLAPANNAALHLSEDELVAVRKEVKLRLAIVMLSACILLFLENR